MKTPDREGYHALQLGFDDKRMKSASKPEVGHAKKTGNGPKRFVREIRFEDDPPHKAGDVLTVDIFKDVKIVDVIGRSKGRGFTGPMKRWNFHGQPASHGTERKHRSPGAIGRMHSISQGVTKGKKMAGRFGNERATTKCMDLVRIDPAQNLLLVHGSVPGPNGGYVIVQQSTKERERIKIGRVKGSATVAGKGTKKK